MYKITIELINPSVEVAMCDLDLSEVQKQRLAENPGAAIRYSLGYDYAHLHIEERLKAKQNWMNPDNEVRWFERYNAGHINGILLDDKLKVVVKQDGLKIDSFKAADLLQLFAVDHVYSLYPLKRSNKEDTPERISALEVFKSSVGTVILDETHNIETYDRCNLSFLVSKLAYVYHPISNAYTEIFTVRGVQYGKSDCMDISIDAKGDVVQHTWYHQYGTTYEPSSSIIKKDIKKFAKRFLK